MSVSSRFGDLLESVASLGRSLPAMYMTTGSHSTYEPKLSAVGRERHALRKKTHVSGFLEFLCVLIV